MKCLVWTSVLLALVACSTEPAGSIPDQLGERNTTVVIDGRLVLPHLDQIGFRWTMIQRPAESEATLDEATTSMPSFFADHSGEYAVELSVGSGLTWAYVQSVRITVTNAKPTANAGLDRHVVSPNKVALDGSRSLDANSDALTYQWTIESAPVGSNPRFDDAEARKPELTVGPPGDYVVSLVVDDGEVASESHTITVRAAGIYRPIRGVRSISDVIYSASHDLIVLSSFDNVLRTISPATGTVRSVALAFALEEISLSDDERYVLVRHPNGGSLVDLATNSLVATTTWNGFPRAMALVDTTRAYYSSGGDQMAAFDPVAGTLLGPSEQAPDDIATVIRAPGQRALYSMLSGSPRRMVKWDTTTTPVSIAQIKEVPADVSIFSFSEDGRRAFARSGTVIHTTDSGTDMTVAGVLHKADGAQVTAAWISESSEANLVARLPESPGAVHFHDATTLTQLWYSPTPEFIAAEGWRSLPLAVFFSASGDEYYTVTLSVKDVGVGEDSLAVIVQTVERP